MEAARAFPTSSFYQRYALQGIHVDRVEPGLVFFTFKVPARLLDKRGHLAPGALVNLVDEMGSACCTWNLVGFLPATTVTVNTSISFLSTAKLDDELEISSKLLGTKGNYSETFVLIKNKLTGEHIAKGRNSLLHKQASKL